MNILAKVFEEKKPFVAYLTAGDPNLKQTKKMIIEFIKAGVDVIELGIPFSDPLADGPTIQASHQRALKNNTHMSQILELVKELKQKHEIPIIFMGALNLFLAYGLNQFFTEAQAVGVDGLIIPDLPPEESKDFLTLGNKHKIDLIYLASTLSSVKRLGYIAQISTPFIYLISSLGVTGTRQEINYAQIEQDCRRIKKITDKPVAVGFGISTPQQASKILNYADGIIVGSAIVKEISKSPKRAVKFIKKFNKEMENL